MIRFQDYLTDKVEQVAAECGIRVYQAAEMSDCGWWIFKDKDGATKTKLYYDFDSDYCSVKEGRGVLCSGVRCYYGNDADEKKLLDFIQEKLPRVMSIEETLENAAKRSALTGVGLNSTRLERNMDKVDIF